MNPREKTYAILGVAGFVAPRHLHAIKVTGGTCVAAMDPHDSVGILDSYFPECQFFTEFGRFERFLEKIKSDGCPIDYLVVCTPNYLHDSNVRFGLRYGCDVICEKPLAINPHNVISVQKAEKEYGQRVFNILQLRLHPNFKEIRKIVSSVEHVGRVNLNYHAPRGAWYHSSWKGNEAQSGGILMNIGVHLFDILIQLFGQYESIELVKYGKNIASGSIIFPGADVNWKLDIRPNSNMAGKRELKLLDHSFDFTGKIKNLHVESYKMILNGNGFSSDSVLMPISLVSKYREMNQNQEKYVSL